MDAVIFDLDGVLVDSRSGKDAQAAFAAARRTGPPPTVAVMGANGRQWSATMRERLAGSPDHAIEAATSRRSWALSPGRRPGHPGAAAASVAWRSATAAVASSAHRDVIAAALEATGLGPCFQVVVRRTRSRAPAPTSTRDQPPARRPPAGCN
jgi:beta-phosphoglucomutase-like phosphatase (HAD superfamily)